MIPEKYIVILLTALGVAHQPHGARLRTEILYYADMPLHKIIHEFLGQRKVLT